MKSYAPDNAVMPYTLRPRHDSSTLSSTYYTDTAIPSNPASSSTNPPQPSSSIPVQMPSSSLSASGTISGPLVFTTTFPVTTVTQPTTTFTSFTESIVTQYPSSLSHSIPSAASAAFSTQSLIQSRTGALCPGHGFDSAAAGIIATVLVPTAIGLILWVNPLHHVFSHQRLTIFSSFLQF